MVIECLNSKLLDNIRCVAITITGFVQYMQPVQNNPGRPRGYKTFFMLNFILLINVYG